MRSHRVIRAVLCLSALFCTARAIFAQQPPGTLQGQVFDSSGAVIPAATVTVTNLQGVSTTVTTDVRGAYTVPGLPPGSYAVRAIATGFAEYLNRKVEVVSAHTTSLSISLSLAVGRQEITVEDKAAASVSTEPANNASAIVLGENELDAFPDDPDDLLAELQALAGPAAGPNGGQIYIDGFMAGGLPPKASIREVRINQNPLSAEYDRFGFGRIEVLTKPGSDKLRGQLSFNFGDSVFNSRNPYAPRVIPFQQRLYGGNFSGPLSKRSSFFLDFERRDIDDDVLINTTVIDPASLGHLSINEAVMTPNRRTTASPRVDYQLSQSNTLTARYRFTQFAQDNAGLGTFALPTRAYDTSLEEHLVQISETAVLSARAINETRFQFTRTQNHQFGDNTIPAINVLGAFSGGGAQVGRALNVQNRWELQNYSTIMAGAHSLKFGLQLRGAGLADSSPQNFGGTFTFSGGTSGPELDANGNVVLDATGNPVFVPIDSLERYRRTLLLQQEGFTPAQVQALGGGASLFTMTAGNPQAAVSQLVLGAFLQDDWRLRPNFTLSLGLRYEAQTNIHDGKDFAPRLGFAWAPGSNAQKRKTVLRGGFGIFYSRFGENLTLQALRFNGLNEQQYIISNPDFFPIVPTASALTSGQSPVARWQVAKDLRAPYVMQSVIGIERQLPWHTTVASTVTYTRGEHILDSRDINAPQPGTYVPGVSGSGVRPYGPGDIFQYESNGIMRAIGWHTTMSNHLGKRLGLFAMYGYGVTHNDTDGPGAFPADQYNLAADYGRSSFDMRHHFEAGGSFTSFRGIRFSPIFVGRSGLPINITSGRDINGDGLYTDRPAFASDPATAGVMPTPFGPLDPNPTAGEKIIPRNYAQGPAYVILQMRVSKTFAFGGGRKQKPADGATEGFQSVFGDTAAEKRYGLTISVAAHNLFNTVNPDNPVAVLTSPLFWKSQALASYFGPPGGAANRKLDLQLRFSF